MSFGDEYGQEAHLSRPRPNAEARLPPAPSRAIATAVTGSHDENFVNTLNTTNSKSSHGAHGAHNALHKLKDNNNPHTMNSAHSKKLSSGSLPDLNPYSPSLEHSRIPQPASRTSSSNRRQPPVTLAQALKHVTDKHLASQAQAQGSPSPAPRPRRPNAMPRPERRASGSPERQHLQDMHPVRPLNLDRLGAPGNGILGLGSSGSGPNLGFSSRKEDETEDEFDQKIRRYGDAGGDLRMMTSTDEKNGGPFFTGTRKVAVPLNGARATASPSTRQASATGAASPTSTGNEGERVYGNGDVGNDSFGSSHRDGPRPGWGDKAKLPRDASWLQRFQNKAEQAQDFNINYSPDPHLVNACLGKRKIPHKTNDADAPVDRPVERAKRKSAWPAPLQSASTMEPLKQADGFSSKAFDVDDDFTAENVQVSTSPPVSFGRADKLNELQQIRQREIVTEAMLPPRKDLFLARTNNKIENVGSWEDDHVKASMAEALESATNKYTSSDGERIPDTPITVYPGRPSKKPSPVNEDSRELLRKLARASSKSPSPVQDKVDSKPQQEQKVEPAPVSDNTNNKAISDDQNIRVDAVTDNNNLAPKPSVGFAGLTRRSSSTSVASKDSVRSHDPTARIQSEAKLFAPSNWSERGSIRAPSPPPSPDPEMETKDDEETPRPNKFADPDTMPTPQVVGAYIDTPAPVKVDQQAAEEGSAASPSKFLSPKKSVSKNRDPSTSPRGSRSEGSQPIERQSLYRNLRRTKSASRHRSPLKNSAKPPTVKDDLREICLKNDIDDSDAEEIKDLIVSLNDPSLFVKLLKNDKTQSEGAMDDQLKMMSESLNTGLAGIRTAKKGIERLEEQVSRPERQDKSAANHITNQQTQPAQPARPTRNPSTTTGASAQSDVYTYISVPVPKLWRTKPKFKLTLTGLLLLLLGLWELYWLVEGLFYDQWGKQTVCYRGSPCRWNPEDPEYGYVIPVKLDQWVTGGAVRPHAAYWLEEAQDGWADFEEWWYGIDIREVHHPSIKDPMKKQQYWRRIEKKGYFPKWNPAPEWIPQIEAWEREAQAKEEAETRAALGYAYRAEPDNETDSMGKDQAVNDDSTDDPPGRWW